MAIAAALTVFALPAVWFANEDDANDRSAAPNVAAVGVDAERAVGPAGATEPPRPDDPLTGTGGTVPPPFLAGPTAASSPEPIVVARPQTEGESIVVDATFRRSVSRGVCEANRVPDGTEATVLNLENGRSVECVVGPSASSNFDEVALNPDDFQMIADVTDAPVRVEISW